MSNRDPLRHQQIDTFFFSLSLTQVEQVRLVDRFSNKSTNGTLYLTATHLIFVESNSNNSASAGQEIWVSGLPTAGSCPGHTRPESFIRNAPFVLLAFNSIHE